MRIGITLSTTILALAVAACSAGSDEESRADRVSIDVRQPDAPTEDKSRDAQAVIEALAQQDLPVKLTVVYGANTDPNHLLGRPRGYTSKASFSDSRILPSEAAGSTAGAVELGGSVEVFLNPEEARRRADYIQGIAKSAPVFTEYDYVKDTAVVRISKLLSPVEAQAYERALSRI